MENINLINKFFEKVYVITCKDFTDRQNYIKKHFSKFNIKFEFYCSTSPSLLISNCISKSELSLLNSHLNCIINSKLNGYKNVLICEDDVEFIDDLYEQFYKFYKILPNDWDLMQLGNQFWATHWLKREYIDDNLYRFLWGTGSHCIGINQKSYDDIIQVFTEYSDPTDFMYYKLFNTLKCYCPEHFLVDSLSKNNHLNHFNSKYVFDSTINHINL